MKLSRSLIAEYGAAIGISIVLAVIIRVFLVEAFKVPTSVMRPSLLPGDYIFASKISYGVKIPFSREYFFHGAEPEYGDVVIYESSAERDNLIKRVVGLPGDEIELRKGHLVFNKTEPKFEPGKSPSCGHELHPKFGFNICLDSPLPPEVATVKVPEKYVYVLADYRTQASIRKKVGELIPMTAIKAKALFIWLSVTPKTETDGVSFFPQIRFDRLLTGVN
ncbi:MAG: signal peptidase I [Xanthomonadaceae bacterium]|nr:signal peptidase I [Xanthomonadaceae bacterium]